MTYTVRHAIDADAETFWRLTFDVEVARALMQSLGNAGDFSVTEDRTDAQGLRHRRVEVWAKTRLPKLVKKFIGDGSYVETGRFDAQANRYTADCVPNVNGDKFRTHYVITAEPGPEGSCVRVITTENSVRVPGVGGLILGKLEEAQRKSHDHSAAFLNAWLRRQ